MTHRYTRRFRVRHYELDAGGHVSPTVYVQFMQEAAIEAAMQAGFGPDWYRERNTGWVVRRLTVRYHADVGYGEDVDVVTWLSRMRGVRSTREYDVVRVPDGARVARGRAEWIYVDRRTGQPVRFPADMAAALVPSSEEEDLGVRLTDSKTTEGAHRYLSRRRVQFHELDPAWHVSHAVYLQWIGQASRDALRDAGHSLEQLRQEGWLVLQAGHDIEFFAPALDGEPIEVASWICELDQEHSAWTHEIYHADTARVLARAYALNRFLNAAGQPATPPRQFVEDILRGQVG